MMSILHRVHSQLLALPAALYKTGSVAVQVAVAQMTTRARFELHEKHMKAGERGSSASQQPVSVIDEKAVASIRSTVHRVNADIKQHQQALICLLQLQADVDLQFLLFRLDQSGESSALRKQCIALSTPTPGSASV